MALHVPQRTCVACRSIDARGALVRLAFESGRLVVDRTGARPGRGAWVHARPACVDRLGGPGRGGLAKSLKREISGADVASMVAVLRAEWTSQGEGQGVEGGAQLSASADISGDRRGDRREVIVAGQPGEEAVDMAPRINAKDQRSEDARL